MPDLRNDERRMIRSASGRSYELYNAGGIYSCSCPAWRNQSVNPNYRTCKHLREFRGSAVEDARIRAASAPPPTPWPGTSPNRAGPPIDHVDRAFGRALKYEATTRIVLKSSPDPVRTTAWDRLNGPDLFGDDPAAPEEEGDSGGDDEDATVMLAQTWDGVLDPTGWLMSEKLDGVRAYWDGQVFRSRKNNVFHVPDWYCEGMPKIPLDGEFWIDRGRFQETSGYVRRHSKGEEWRQIKYMVFDAPEMDAPFESRYLHLCAEDIPAHVQIVYHIRCSGVAHLRRFLAETEKLKGEGVMIRRADSRYERCRSDALLKVKSFHDAEATVVGHTKGKGKYNGMTGALICRTHRFFNDKISINADVEFKCGTGMSDEERRNPPKIGSTITYRFMTLTKKGVPREPRFVACRDYE